MMAFFISSLVPLSCVVQRPFLLAGGIVLLASILFQAVISSRRKNPLLPPGPKPLPLVGNLLQVNLAEPWLTYTAWRRKYGDLLHVRFLGQAAVVLNSERTARALLDQRSALYSDRPVLRAYSIFAVDYSTTLLPYGEEWRLHRVIYQHSFRSESEARSRDVHLRMVRILLVNLLDTPEDFEMHLKSYVASNVIALAYGYETTTKNDPMITNIISLCDLLSKLLSPERRAILSAFPFLERLPGWLPGSGLWRDVSRVRKLSTHVLEEPFNWVKDRMAAGDVPKSWVADCLSELVEKDDRHKQEHAIKSTAVMAFATGYETSWSTLHTFVLAMVLYPEVQAKAQVEIDSVIGSGRLPHFDDRESLPYVDATLRELFRWNPVLPMGVPHATSADDVYEGYHIPKGTLIIANVWAMARNEDRYTDADAFKPERFLTAEGKLKDGPPISADPIFGFGESICPGRFAAEALVWTAIVSILATFRISKARDANGSEKEVKRRFTTGLAVRPVRFSCWFISRSVDREHAIRKGSAEQPEVSVEVPHEP